MLGAPVVRNARIPRHTPEGTEGTMLLLLSCAEQRFFTLGTPAERSRVSEWSKSITGTGVRYVPVTRPASILPLRLCTDSNCMDVLANHDFPVPCHVGEGWPVCNILYQDTFFSFFFSFRIFWAPPRCEGFDDDDILAPTVKLCQGPHCDERRWPGPAPWTLGTSP